MAVEIIEIKFKAFDYRALDQAINLVVETAKKTGATIHGPIPIPTQIERFTVNRSPHVNKESREQFEIRTHKRNMIITPSAQTIDALKKLELAEGVDVKIKILEGGKA